jgi:hypothetical protein
LENGGKRREGQVQILHCSMKAVHRREVRRSPAAGPSRGGTQRAILW